MATIGDMGIPTRVVGGADPVGDLNAVVLKLQELITTINNITLTAGGTTDPVARASIASINALLGTNIAGMFATLTAHLVDIDTKIGVLQGVRPPGPTKSQLVWARASFTQPVTAPTIDNYALIPGYPGTGKIRMGQASATADGPFDQLVYSTTGYSTTPLHCSIAREYLQSGPLWSAGEQSVLRGHTSLGRVPIATFKTAPYSYAQVVSGAADADWIATCTFIKSLTGIGGTANAPIWCSYWHEPENIGALPANPSSAQVTQALADQDNYRSGYRHLVEVARAQGVTNIAWCAPFWMSLWDWQHLDPKLWHPEWSGTAWLTNPDGTRKKYIDLLGIDYYDPTVYNSTTVNFNSTTRNRLPTGDIVGVIIAMYLRMGGRPMPIVIGEHGIYSFLSTLEADGVSAELIVSDLMDNCVQHPTMPVIGTCVWNNGQAGFDPTTGDPKRVSSDPFGPKTMAYRNVAAGMILRTNTGAQVTPATPQANRVWVPDTFNRVVSV